MKNNTTGADSVEKIAQALRGLAAVVRKHGICPPAALDECADRLAALSSVAPAQVGAEWEHCDACGYMTRNGARCSCAEPDAAAAGVGEGGLVDTLANLVLRWRQLASEFDDKVTRDMAAELNQWLIGIAEGYDRAADELEAVMNAGAGA